MLPTPVPKTNVLTITDKQNKILAWPPTNNLPK